MEIEYTSEAVEDLKYWKKHNNTILLQRIRQLIESISETPTRELANLNP